MTEIKKPDYSEVGQKNLELRAEMKKEKPDYNPHALDQAPTTVKAQLTKKWIKRAGLDEEKVFAALGLPKNVSDDLLVQRVMEFQNSRNGLGNEGILGPKSLAALDRETGDEGDFSKDSIKEIKEKKWETREEAMAKTLKEAARAQLAEALGKEAQLQIEITTTEENLKTTTTEIASLENKKTNGKTMEEEDIYNAGVDLRLAEDEFKPKKETFYKAESRLVGEITPLNSEIDNLEKNINQKEGELAGIEDKLGNDYTTLAGEISGLRSQLSTLKSNREKKQRELLTLKESFDTEQEKIDALKITRNSKVREIFDRYNTRYQEIDKEIADLQTQKSSQEILLAKLKSEQDEQKKLIAQLEVEVGGDPSSATVASVGGH